MHDREQLQSEFLSAACHIDNTECLRDQDASKLLDGSITEVLESLH